MKNILLIVLISVFIVARASEDQSAEPPAVKQLTTVVADHSEKSNFDDAIADCFIGAIRKANYSFLTEADYSLLRKEISDFSAKYKPTHMPPAKQESLLSSIDCYVSDYFLNRPNCPDDPEGAYLKFRDQINTFKWKLWLAITRKPPTPEQLKQRQIQHDWLRGFIANVPIRPGDGRPLGVSPEGVRKWASKYLERELADLLSLLYELMTHSQFEVFKKLMIRSSANGLYNTVTDIPFRAIGAKAHNDANVENAYSYPFDIELPFKDEVRSIWGGGGGAGTHLVFASNAQFRGRDVFLDSYGNRQIFDVVQGILRLPPEVRDNATDKLIANWAKKQNKGDIFYNDMTASLLTLRGAKIAELKIANWFEADRISNAELQKLITKNGRETVSVKKLPPMNRLRRLGVTDPRFFVIVQSYEGRLAVIDMKCREFGQLYLVSRLR